MYQGTYLPYPVAAHETSTKLSLSAGLHAVQHRITGWVRLFEIETLTDSEQEEYLIYPWKGDRDFQLHLLATPAGVVSTEQHRIFSIELIARPYADDRTEIARGYCDTTGKLSWTTADYSKEAVTWAGAILETLMPYALTVPPTIEAEEVITWDIPRLLETSLDINSNNFEDSLCIWFVLPEETKAQPSTYEGSPVRQIDVLEPIVRPTKTVTEEGEEMFHFDCIGFKTTVKHWQDGGQIKFRTGKEVLFWDATREIGIDPPLTGNDLPPAVRLWTESTGVQETE